MRYAARAAGQSPTFTPPARTRASPLRARVRFRLRLRSRRRLSFGVGGDVSPVRRRRRRRRAPRGPPPSVVSSVVSSSPPRRARFATRVNPRAVPLRGAPTRRESEARRARRDASPKSRRVAPPALWPRRTRRRTPTVLLNTRDAVLLNTRATVLLNTRAAVLLNTRATVLALAATCLLAASARRGARLRGALLRVGGVFPRARETFLRLHRRSSRLGLGLLSRVRVEFRHVGERGVRPRRRLRLRLRRRRPFARLLRLRGRRLRRRRATRRRRRGLDVTTRRRARAKRRARLLHDIHRISVEGSNPRRARDPGAPFARASPGDARRPDDDPTPKLPNVRTASTRDDETPREAPRDDERTPAPSRTRNRPRTRPRTRPRNRPRLLFYPPTV